MTDTATELAAPLTLWEKTKAGVKGFAKAVLHYLPRGLMFGALLMGSSMLLGDVAGESWNFLQITPENMLSRAAFSMALGSLISGGVGSYHSVQEATAHRNMEIVSQTEQLKRAKAMVPQREIEYSSGFSPQANLPLSPEKAQLQIQ